MASKISGTQFRVYGSGEGIEPLVAQLKNFVPMTELSESHLKTASRLARLVTIPAGELVADSNLLSSHYVYLWHGEVQPRGSETRQPEAASMLPLGSVFGEQQAIVARNDCQIILIAKNQLDSMLCWDQVAKSLMIELCSERDYDEDRSWLQTLLMSNLFHKLPPFNIRQIVDQFTPRCVGTDEVIIRQGARGDECYIIKEGEAIVTVYDEIEQREQEVARLRAGQCFGEDALVNKTQRNATVRMAANGVLMVLKKREFLALMNEPAIFSVPFEQASDAVSAGACWLDVRTQPEFDHASLPGAFHLPMHLMVLKSRMMDKDQQYYAVCGTGRRAATAAYLLQRNGFNVIPVKQGISDYLS